MRLEVPTGSASRSCGLQLKPAHPWDTVHEGLYSPGPRWHVSRRSASSWGEAGAYGANSRAQASGTRPQSRAASTAFPEAPYESLWLAKHAGEPQGNSQGFKIKSAGFFQIEFIKP